MKKILKRTSVKTEVEKLVCPFCGKPEIEISDNEQKALIEHVGKWGYVCDGLDHYNGNLKQISVPGHENDIIVAGLDSQIWHIAFYDDYDLITVWKIKPISEKEAMKLFNDEMEETYTRLCRLEKEKEMAKSMFKGG